MSVDPAMRQVVGGRAKERMAASTSLMGRFETEILTQSINMELLKNLSGQWVDKVCRIILKKHNNSWKIYNNTLRYYYKTARNRYDSGQSRCNESVQ